MKINKEEIEKLSKIADEIIEFQESNALLSGSLALYQQSIPILRTPKDIDIVMLKGFSFKKLEGMTRVIGAENDEYDNDYYERISYSYKGIQVDVFIPLDDVENMLVSEDSPTVVHYAEIMKMKIMHAYGEHYTRYKHQKDIIHFINLAD